MNTQFPGENVEATIAKLRKLATDLSRIRSGEGPTRAEMVGAPVLDWWSLGVRPARCLIGMPHGHPILRESNRVATSELFAIDTSRGFARTYSRIYKLGVPSGEPEGGEHDAPLPDQENRK
jgi:hypothetical protein